MSATNPALTSSSAGNSQGPLQVLATVCNGDHTLGCVIDQLVGEPTSFSLSMAVMDAGLCATMGNSWHYATVEYSYVIVERY